MHRDVPTGFRVGSTHIACRALTCGGEYLVPVGREQCDEVPVDGFPDMPWKPPRELETDGRGLAKGCVGASAGQAAATFLSERVMEADEWDGKELAEVGGPIDNLIEAKIRAAVRQLIQDSFTPENVGKSMANGLAGVRKAVGALPLFVQELFGHALDKLDVQAADPEVEAAVAQWLRDTTLPLLG